MTARNLALDKTKHFLGGALTSALVGYVASLVLDPTSAVLTGLTVAVLVGVLKEAVWDTWLGRGVSDKYDLYATMLGGLFGSLVIAGLWYAVFRG